MRREAAPHTDVCGVLIHIQVKDSCLNSSTLVLVHINPLSEKFIRNLSRVENNGRDNSQSHTDCFWLGSSWCIWYNHSLRLQTQVPSFIDPTTITFVTLLVTCMWIQHSIWTNNHDVNFQRKWGEWCHHWDLVLWNMPHRYSPCQEWLGYHHVSGCSRVRTLVHII